MKINFRSKKGFSTVDFSIAMIIIIMFVVIMTSVSYNIYLTSIGAKRTAEALNYAVDIFENIGKLNFSEVVTSYDLFEIEGLKSFQHVDISTSDGAGGGTVKGKIGPYNATIKIENYNGIGVMKIITLKMEYQISRKDTETIELQRIKVVEEQV